MPRSIPADSRRSSGLHNSCSPGMVSRRRAPARRSPRLEGRHSGRSRCRQDVPRVLRPPQAGAENNAELKALRESMTEVKAAVVTGDERVHHEPGYAPQPGGLAATTAHVKEHDRGSKRSSRGREHERRLIGLKTTRATVVCSAIRNHHRHRPHPPREQVNAELENRPQGGFLRFRAGMFPDPSNISCAGKYWARRKWCGGHRTEAGTRRFERLPTGARNRRRPPSSSPTRSLLR